MLPDEWKSASPPDLNTAEAEITSDGLRLSMRRLTAGAALCWGLARVGLLLILWSWMSRGRLRTSPAVWLALAAVPAIVFTVRYLREQRELNGMIARLPAEDVRQAFQRRTNVYDETKLPLRAGCALLALTFVFGFVWLDAMSIRTAWPPFPYPIPLSGVCLTLSVWLLLTRMRMRNEATDRAVQSAIPLYAAEVCRIFGEEAQYSHEWRNDGPIPDFWRCAPRDYLMTAHIVDFPRSGSRVTLCDANLYTHAGRGGDVRRFTGTLVRVDTGRLSQPTFAIRRVSARKLRRETGGRPLEFETVFEPLRGMRDARAAYEALLTPSAQRRLIDLKAVGVSFDGHGQIAFAVEDMRLLPDTLTDIDADLRQLRDCAALLLPLIDDLIPPETPAG